MKGEAVVMFGMENRVEGTYVYCFMEHGVLEK
jgi:hypothetical protein